jgi:tetraacyldisaccharide 4'-kinase
MQALRLALMQAWGRDARWPYPVLSYLLWPISAVFAVLVAIRRTLYRRGLLSQHRLPVPVLVVGNVMVGGVGKTPIVMALVQHLTQQGWRVGVVSRGYGRSNAHMIKRVQADSTAQEVGDEPLLIARNCQVPVCVGSDRVAAAQALLAQHPEVQVLVCDDGLQHLALARDLELVVFDERGTGNGYLLPAGPLREPWPRQASVGRAVPSWVLKTSGQAGPDEWAVQRSLANFAVQADGTQRPLSSWGARSVQALAGIAKPEVFFAMLREQGMHLCHTQALADHAELHALHIDASQGDVLCTEKDAVKLWAHHPHAWAVPLQTTLPTELLAAIDLHLAQAQHAKLSSPHGHQTA